MGANASRVARLRPRKLPPRGNPRPAGRGRGSCRDLGVESVASHRRAPRTSALGMGKKPLERLTPARPSMAAPSDEVVARVRQVVEEAAAAPIRAGRAEVAVRRLADVYAEATYDCPVIVLTPAEAEAARVVVEVQADELWWLIADGGPGTELYVGMTEDRFALLGSLVRAVVAGEYRHGPHTEERRRVFRSPRRLRGWFETFQTDDGPITSIHILEARYRRASAGSRPTDSVTRRSSRATGHDGQADQLRPARSRPARGGPSPPACRLPCRS